MKRRRHHSRALTERSLRWLLWLALLVPVAQVAADWHALSHVAAGSPGNPAGEDKAPHHTQCDYCVATVALAAGVPSGTSISPPTLHGPDLLPCAAPLLGAQRPCAIHYRGRAPPLARY